MSGPVNLDYERLIIGAVLLAPELMHAARPLLDSSEFSLAKHQQVWKHACALYDNGQPVEVATVIHALNNSGALQSCGGHVGISELTEGVPMMPSLDSYVAGVKDKALLRNVIAASQHTINRCMEGSESGAVILESLGQTAHTLAPQTKNGGLRSAAQIIDSVGITSILRPRRETGLSFPWPWMNYRTGGMLPAELWILAGHTGTGKTSAMLQHAVTAARRGQCVAIFSLEVGDQALIQKSIYQFGGIDSELAKRGRLDPEQKDAERLAAEAVYELPLYLDTQSSTPMAIHAAVRRLSAKRKVDHVIVDYLQLLGNSGKVENRAQAVGANAWAMTMLATDFKIPVLLLSQFSRQSARPGQTREPVLSDLKESGDIENHANGVWFLHRETEEDSDQIPVKFILPKQRDGRRNVSQHFYFLPTVQRFEQVQEDDWQ